jgi:primosomal protein N' (replication factor Y)
MKGEGIRGHDGRLVTGHRSRVTGSVVRVAPVPPPGRLTVLDYRVPPSLGAPGSGTRVLIPLGPRRCMGVVVDLAPAGETEAKLRDVIAVLDETPVLDGILFDLVRWMADYYLAPLGEAIATALPGALRVETERWVHAIDGFAGSERLGSRARAVLDLLVREGPQPVAKLRQSLGGSVSQVLGRLQRSGAATVVERVRREIAPTRHARLYEAVRDQAAATRLARRPALNALYEYLCNHPLRQVTAGELAGFPDATAKLRALAEAGLVKWRDEERYRPVLPPMASPDRRFPLSSDQQAAAAAIGAAMEEGFVPFLLWGVTGSGKTEVYLHAIAAALERRRTALVLVPEISLTHQIVDRVRARFGDDIAVLHSQLSTGERWDEWRRIARGEARIVIGARSAVFAPLRALGVVIVDEEHDGAYKQADGVRYHGRDVAVMRAKLAVCPLILGSATPSMESFHNATTRRYRLLRLPERVESRPLPEVEVVDLRRLSPAEPVAFSPALDAALEANLAAGAQSLVFLNRRGFANFLQCRACGDPIQCPHCSVTLTWHRRWRALRCHYCDHTVPRPERCTGCGEPALSEWGFGTEQIEALLRARFPAARVGRMDRDTTRRKGSQARLLQTWERGGFDILVGTQMITKGHDVHGVTLVGVLLADTSLNLPDFRASERTFQLLAQVAGRAGRGDRRGRVIVQTLQPLHYSLRTAAAHDFATFAREEMTARRERDYPPFTRLVLLRVEGEDLARVRQIATAAAEALRAQATGRFAVLGPAPAALERLRRRHRWQLLLRGYAGRALRAAAAQVRADVEREARSAGVRLLIDVDPYHLM